MQSPRGDWCSIESALGGEARFLWSVINGTEKHAWINRALRHLFGANFVCAMFQFGHFLLPKGAQLVVRHFVHRHLRIFGEGRKGEACYRPKDQSEKKSPIGPPSNTSIGNFLNSYS